MAAVTGCLSGRPGTSVSPGSVSAGSVSPSSGQPADGQWTENFSGPAGAAPDRSLFTARTGGNGWGNAELQTYTGRAANAALDGSGHLAVRAVREQYTGADGIARGWTSARLDSLDRWSFTTGTLSVRMKVPAGAGMWPAFWLLGTDLPTVNWPAAGEIDVVEALGGRNVAYQSVHGPRTGTSADGTAKNYAHSVDVPVAAEAELSDDFHIFSVSRRFRRIEFFVDGTSSGVLTPASLTAGQSWVFDKPMFMIVNLAVGGWPGAPTAGTPSPSTLLVDWIRFAP